MRRRVLLSRAAVAAVAVFGFAASAAAQDADGDGVVDGVDNCPYVYNPLQEDAGGLGNAGPDGVGDVCQCGDLDADGRVDLLDAARYQRDLAALTPGAEDPDTCSVVGGRLDCEPNDRTALREALVGIPGLGQVCQAASGIPPLPLELAASGDSITRGFSATCECNEGFLCLLDLFSCADDQPGYSYFDGPNVLSLLERYKLLDPAIDADKSASVSGAEMKGGDDNFAAQVDAILALVPAPELVVVELGGNDICNRDCADGCSNALYSDQEWTDALRAGLDKLTGHSGPGGLPPGSTVYLMGVVRIQDLRDAGIALQASDPSNIDCENMWAGGLGVDICTIATQAAPFNGEDLATRTAAIAERVRRYNEILRDEALAYSTNANGRNPSGLEVVSDYVNEAIASTGTQQFGAEVINGGDCFHPNVDGQNLLSGISWDGNPRK